MGDTSQKAASLDEAKNVWMATVRPNGRPHLVPVWFVTDGDRWYVCTAPGSVKARNLKSNPQIALALEDGNQPFIVEGEARPVSPSATVIDRFKVKYGWDITTEALYTELFEVTVRKQVMAPNGTDR